MNEVARFAIEPKTLTEAMDFAKMIASSSFCPSQMKNKPGDVILAMQMGSEVGLSPMQAIQNIAVINGRPCLWGDAALAVAMGSSQFFSHREWLEGTIKDGNLTAFCGVTRKNHEEHIKSFSMDDAKKSNLWGKTGPWSQYPERMLQMRARAFAIRDKFSDALRGISFAEEVSDYQEVKEVKSNVRTLHAGRRVDHEAYQGKHQKMLDKAAIDVEVQATDEQAIEFPDFMNAIEICSDLTQLECVFNEIKKMNYKETPDLFKKLIDAKDKRKAELNYAYIIQPEEIQRDNVNCAGSASDSGEI